ncbi:MAG: hypothetical protein GDA43_18635 [Hormoscilla sp. SP5CHS1]|nr:hypothetical protein [Hormoscilla sp. SP12CHS1]MBC6454968.1 hypothetical protein [Hormoscilla sp. SP5CHS1]
MAQAAYRVKPSDRQILTGCHLTSSQFPVTTDSQAIRPDYTLRYDSQAIRSLLFYFLSG